MKKKPFMCLALGALLGAGALSSCAAKAFEEELNIVFLNEGEIVASDTITQFKNTQSPTLPEEYIPVGYRFLGWTTYEMDQIDTSSVAKFQSQYIGAGRMVHYKEAKPFAVNSTVTYKALFMDKDDIPKEYHYSVVAWYDKAATSGIVASEIETLEGKLKTYLAGKGVSQDDLDTILFRGYTGNVGPSTGQILYDDDVDIMLGWGSVSNITTTGSIPADTIYQSEEYQVTYNAEVKNRYLHRISDTDKAKLVTEYLISEEARAIFNS